MTNVVVNRKLKVLNSQAFWRVYFISLLSLIFLKVKIVQCYFFLEDSVFKRKQKKKKRRVPFSFDVTYLCDLYFFKLSGVTYTLTESLENTEMWDGEKPCTAALHRDDRRGIQHVFLTPVSF